MRSPRSRTDYPGASYRRTGGRRIPDCPAPLSVRINHERRRIAAVAIPFRSPPPQTPHATSVALDRDSDDRCPDRVVRKADVFGEHAFSNIATLILSFVGVVALAVWFFFFSGYGQRSRLLTFAGCVAGLALFYALLRLDRFTGELLPTLCSVLGKARSLVAASTG